MSAPGRALVLLVDDSEPVRDAYTILLEESGYRVAAAADAGAALQAAAETPPDIVLLDLGLPGLDGLHVARALKRDPGTAHVPVLALTGRDDPQARLACAEAGCAEFLVKPFPTQLLLRILAEHLSRS